MITVSGETVRSKSFNNEFKSVIIANVWYLMRISDEELYKVRLKNRSASIRCDDDCDFELVPFNQTELINSDLACPVKNSPGE